MAKKLVKEVNDTIIKVPISKFIDTQFRDYALYVLEARGIPSFYDALTNIQRYIFKNCPSSFVKTLTVVGKCIEDHYHHGPASLESAIARVTRPFGTSAQLLNGYGFFGTEVCPIPSAARYTAVKNSTLSKDVISKYSYLTTRVPEGPYNYFWYDFPIGLAIPIIGIAVGYKTMILPRKLDEVQKYIMGQKANLTPYFEGFNGTIKRYQSNKNWLIQGTVTSDGKKINATNMPPLIKYTSLLKKIDVLFSKYEGKIAMENNSDTNVNITLNYKGNSQEEFDDILSYMTKLFSIIVTENIVFIKDSKVLEYEQIDDYLEDWKWQFARLKYECAKHNRDNTLNEYNYEFAKREFIEFMLDTKRTVQEVDEFLSKYEDQIKSRLESLTAKKFTSDELNVTITKIFELRLSYESYVTVAESLREEFNAIEDNTLKKSKASKKISMSLFDSSDVEEIDGIMVWNGEDQIFDTEVSEVKDELND